MLHGTQILDLEWNQLRYQMNLSTENYSPDGRWFAYSYSQGHLGVRGDIYLVDRRYLKKEDVIKYRQSNGRLDPLWHQWRAQQSANQDNIYATTFHLAVGEEAITR